MNTVRTSLSRRFCATLTLSIFILALTAPASAAIIAPTISVSIDDGPTPSKWSWTPTENDLRLIGPDRYQLNAPRDFEILAGRAHVKIQGLDFDSDPFVLNNILVTNTTAIPQVYSVTTGLPTSFGAPNQISGTILTGVIDGGFDGATIATVPATPIYQATIDFAPVASLQNDPFSLSAPPAGVNSASAAFGPTVNAIPVTSSIGIQLRFSLTPADTASVLSRFDVNAVPEPTSLTLIGVTLALLSRRSRRLLTTGN